MAFFKEQFPRYNLNSFFVVGLPLIVARVKYVSPWCRLWNHTEFKSCLPSLLDVGCQWQIIFVLCILCVPVRESHFMSDIKNKLGMSFILDNKVAGK